MTTNDRWQLTTSTGEQGLIWIGHASELNTWDNQSARFLRCEGGTLVNVNHVVVLRPCR